MFLLVPDPLSSVELNFSTDMVWVMNLCIAIIMFSVALSMKREDFSALVKHPKQVLVGLTGQFFLLPAVTFLLVMVLKPYPGLALGMVLVACVPGGNVSNYFTLVGKGNPALSVTITAIATLIAPILTPLNFSFWGGNIPFASELFRSINLDFWKMFQSVMLMLVIPMILGLLFAKHFPKITDKIKGKMQRLALMILVAFIVFAFSGNYRLFMEYYQHIIYLVFLHTLLALGAGYVWGALLTRDRVVARAISIETGIQNSGLGLVLIFSLFDGQGGMALVTAWWGVYDIFSGLCAAYFFRWLSQRNTVLGVA